MSAETRHVGILAEHLYHDLEVHYPRLRLAEAGVRVSVIGTGSAPQYEGKYGFPVRVDTVASDVAADVLDGLIIPGGWAPDRLRTDPGVLRLVRDLFAAGKPVGCICHGGWVLSSAGVVSGRRLTCYHAIRDDMVHAGAIYVDQEVVQDGNLVTSRQPDDLPAFMQTFLRLVFP